MIAVPAWIVRRPAVRTLVSDPHVWLFLVAFAAELVLYLTPVISAQQREVFGAAYFQIPFVAIAIGGAWAGNGATRPPEERRFWRRLGTGFLFWLVGILLYAATPEAAWTPAMSAVDDLAYVASYLTILLAIERRPHLGRAGGPIDLDRRVKAVGVVCFAGGWFAYFAVAPVLLDARFYGSLLPSFFLYLVFDVTILSQAAAIGRRCEVPRWRTIYLMLAAAASIALAVDLADAAATSGLLDMRDGAVTDLIWALPPFAYLLAVRVGRSTLADSEVADGGVRPAMAALEPVRAGGLLLMGACTFPLVHMWLYSTYSTAPALEAAHGVIVLVELGVMGGLALTAYQALARRYRDLERARHAVEARLRDAQRMESIGRLAGGIAHDFNNLLTVIIGYADSAAETLDPRDPVRRYLEDARRAADRAVGLTGQLLAFSRRQVLKAERLDLNQVVGHIERMLRRLIGEDIVLEMRLGPDPGSVMADRVQIESVLLTLAVNARDRMPQGGRLELSTTTVEDPAEGDDRAPEPGPRSYVELAVLDTGECISPEAQAHVFEPFFSTRTGDHGAGLGLATVYGIITQSGGTLSVTSEPQRGTTFSIRLPRAAPAAPAPPVVSRAALQSARGTILVSEDEPAVRDLTCMMLEREGYTVLAASSGEDALAMASTHPGRISLLLTDVKMPRTDGLALAARLVADRPDLRVLYMTGDAADIVWPTGVNHEAIVRKPFTRAVLAGRVRDALENGAS